MQYIKKLKLLNFKKFKSFEVGFKPKENTIIGDNESGKSSLLQAIELVVSGSRNRVESIGIESILNKDAVAEFFSGESSFERLPEVHVELYFGDDSNPDTFGNHNSEKKPESGLHLICHPNEDLAPEIVEVLNEGAENFPYEFYVSKYITFSGESYSSYRKFLKCLTIDSSQISSDYANKEYTKTVYESTVDHTTRVKLKNEYRQHKNQFRDNNLRTINDDLGDYDFSVRSGTKSNLETDLTLMQDNISLEERGKGQQCFIKTQFALSRNNSEQKIDVLLLEEPENHLSHTNMKRLVSEISDSHSNQIIITTHNSLISTRLDLRNSILLGISGDAALLLHDLSKPTAKFFMKAPDNNILEFVLSPKVILVEGDAEFILLDALYTNAIGRSLEEDAVHVISVGGTSFKRYMELAKTIKNKVAVIRDNDKDYQSNCVDNYSDYEAENISVFSDVDNSRCTFEVCIYEDNKEKCDSLFSGGGIQKEPLEFMLDNKAESSLRLADNEPDEINVPQYIEQAFAWINA